VGVVTSRDDFAIDFEEEVLKRRIRTFRDKSLPDEVIKQTFGLKDKENWKLNQVREKVGKDDEWEKAITQILYRPFDIRWIFYHDEVIERSRKEVMRHMMQENLGLLTCRQQNTVGFYHVLACEEIVESCIVSNSTREISYLFPLYLYPGSGKKDMFSYLESGERKPNLSAKLVEGLTTAYGKEPTPEAVFYYIYGILYANTYRSKYAEFLKIDFPRVPFTKDYKLFLKIGELGKGLIELHLMKSAELDAPIAKLQGGGDCKVDKPSYNRDEKRVYTNKSQYFEGVEVEVWEYQIGGYKVAEKWLKDRKGRTLSPDDIKHYCKVITALKKTIEIQHDIDALYPEVEIETVPIDL